MDKITRDRVSEAETTLDRTIGFVRNSDEKTSIALTMTGVIITVIFTVGGESIMKMFSETWNDPDVISIVFVFLFFIFLTFMLFGFYKLIRVLVPKLDSIGFEDESFDVDSKIFFGKICNNASYTEYREKMINYSDDDHLNDLWSQIYINSNICMKKFKNFSLGLRIVVPNLFLLLATIMVFGFFILE